MTRARSLRTHLFAATLAVVVLSIGLMLAIGSVLTRRARPRGASARNRSPASGRSRARRRPTSPRTGVSAAISLGSWPSGFVARAPDGPDQLGAAQLPPHLGDMHVD